MQPFYFETGTSTNFRLAAAHFAFLLLAIWVKYVVARAPVGRSRLLLSLPVLLANVVTPWFFDVTKEVLPRAITIFAFSWLNSFKVLAFCLGREPLRDTMTLPQMAAVMMLPIFPKPEETSQGAPRGRLHDSAGTGTGLALRWVGKLALLGVVVYVEMDLADRLPVIVMQHARAFGVYAFVGFLMDGPGALAVEALGLQLVPTFDQPWLSSSLADWWGRRWNVTTSSVLRTLVYDSIIDGSFINPNYGRKTSSSDVSAANGVAHLAEHRPHGRDGSPQQQNGTKSQLEGKQGEGNEKAQPGGQSPKHKKPSLLRQQLALHATFLTSGLFHEYMAWNLSGLNRWHWKWTLFFYLQAPLMTAEWAGRKALRRAGRRGPPGWLSTLLTLELQWVMSYFLFFGFAERDCDLARRVVTALNANFAAALEAGRPLLEALVPRGWQY